MKIKVWISHSLDDYEYNEYHDGSIGLLTESDVIDGPFLYGPSEDIIYEFCDNSIKMGFRSNAIR